MTTDCPDEATLTDLAAEGIAAGPVADHLEGCPECRARFGRLRGMISGLRLLTRAIGDPPPPRPRAAARHPAVLGNYFLVGVIREDAGMIACRGVHSLVRDEEVAVFLADDPWAGEDRARKAFELACAPLTRLDHPAIARAADLGVFKGRPYLVIEYVAGDRLERLLAGRAFSPREAAAIAAQVARALASAHREGVAHGSLGVGSVTIAGDGRPKLVDFGASRLRNDPAAGPTAAGDLAALGALLRRLTPGSKAVAAICDRAESPDPAVRFADADALARGLERLARPWTSPAHLALAALAAIAAVAVVGWLVSR